MPNDLIGGVLDTSDSLVRTIWALAEKGHAGQLRHRTDHKGVRMPYTTHLVEVALVHQAVGLNSPRALARALGHDLYEDCLPLVYRELGFRSEAGVPMWSLTARNNPISLKLDEEVGAHIVEVTKTYKDETYESFDSWDRDELARYWLTELFDTGTWEAQVLKTIDMGCNWLDHEWVKDPGKAVRRYAPYLEPIARGDYVSQNCPDKIWAGVRKFIQLALESDGISGLTLDILRKV